MINKAEDNVTPEEEWLGTCATVAYIALQVAFCLGFRKVYLFGRDLSMEGRFYPGEQVRRQALHDDWGNRVIEPFTLVRDLIDAGEWSVMNCSPQSKLPESILPKIDPNQALLL